MAIDWDTELLEPVMAVFGEGQATDPSSWPTYIPAGGEAFQLPGAVFDQEYRRVGDLGDGSTETSSHPVLGVRDAVFAVQGVAAKQRDTVMIPSAAQTFAVADVQADGHGHTLLILIQAA